MADELNFNANNVKPGSVNEPLPNGWYTMHVVESAVKPTANGQGRYLELVFECLDEAHKGRRAWDRLNLQNPNEKTVRIAESQLSALCHAAGVLVVKHSSQLHNIPVMVKLVVKQDEGYEPRNEVKGYKSVSGQSVLATAGNGAAPGAPQVRSDAPPWAK